MIFNSDRFAKLAGISDKKGDRLLETHRHDFSNVQGKRAPNRLRNTSRLLEDAGNKKVRPEPEDIEAGIEQVSDPDALKKIAGELGIEASPEDITAAQNALKGGKVKDIATRAAENPRVVAGATQAADSLSEADGGGLLDKIINVARPSIPMIVGAATALGSGSIVGQLVGAAAVVGGALGVVAALAGPDDD